MVDAVYPDDLPIPVRDNFSDGLQMPFTDTPMEDGTTRTRRSWGPQLKKYTLQFNFDWEELGKFEAWGEYDLDQWTGWFTLYLYPEQPAVRLRFVAGEGPSFSMDASTGSWEASATVEGNLQGPVIPANTGVLPVWPATLPIPEKDGYKYGYGEDTPLRSAETSGLAQQRNRWDYRATTFTATWILDESQRKVFENFFFNTLLAGRSWFSAPFANGAGTNMVRARFSANVPQVTPRGAAYEVQATMVTMDAPRMSELMYRTGGLLSLKEQLILTDSISILFRGRLGFTETLVVQDQLSRLFRLSDGIGLLEALGILTRKVLIEGLSLVDVLKGLFKRPFNMENMGLTETLSMRIGKFFNETLTLSESLLRTTLYKRAIADTLVPADSPPVAILEFKRTLTDTETVSASGVLKMQDYIDYSYFAYDYVGESRPL